MEEDFFSGALPADADRYVLVVRWGLILATGLIYAMMKTPLSAYLNPILVLAGVAAYSLPISVYAFQKYPLTRGHPWWLLAGDTTCATAAVVLTGGHTSAFYLLFLLVLIEIALAYRWRVAMTLAVLVDALQLAASMASNGDAINTFVVVNRFVALLVFGVFAILFGENARREEAERRRMAVASAYERRLNQIFLKLGESSMDLERMLGVILESAQRFLGASYAVVLLRDEASDALRVAASSAPPYPVGQMFAPLNWPTGDDQIFVAERGQQGWPDFITNAAVRQVLGVRLLSHTREPMGWIVVGREKAAPLPVFTRNLIRALALEVGFAVHNARLYEREQAHIQRLEAFNASRSTFFSALGHELKTPLTVLKTLAPSLERLPDLPPETRAEITASIQQNLARLETLVTDMLESVRLEAQAVELYPVLLDVGQKISREVAAVQPVFARKQVTVQIEMPSPLLPVLADPRAVRLVLSNLLGNAAKFAPPGSEVRVSVTPQDGEVVVCVEDAGPGVPLDEREKVFDKFYIVSQRRALAGVGLGLFICRELVRLHHGRIWVTDSDLGGSKFCFALPLGKADSPHSQNGEAKAHGEGGQEDTSH